MGPFVFLDIETTGINANKDHIIEIACLLWKDGKVQDKFETLINPHCPLPYEITLLTGITDDDVQKAPLFSEAKQQIVEFIKNLPIVGHNIQFDTGFLKSHHLEIPNPEIDTMALARILLRKEPSYALEVLMKKYGLPTYDSHRAMADTQAALHFFEFLIGKIAEIPEEVIKVVEDVLKKSVWAGREVFIERSNVPPAPLPSNLFHSITTVRATAGKQMSNKSAYKNYWSNEMLKAFLGGEKQLLESTTCVPFSALRKQKLLIAYSSVRKRNELMESAEKENLAVASLKEPYFYLSPKRLEEKLAQPAFTDEEIRFLLKMILWNSETEIGDREEISIEREEFGQFEMMADIDGNDIFWEKAKTEAKKCNVVLVHQYALANGLARDFSSKRKLIIVEASRLEDSFTNAARVKLTDVRLRPFFGDKVSMAFGLLGIFYEHFVEKDYGGFMGNVILDETTRNSIHWKKFIDSVDNWPENPKKAEVIQALSPRENTIQWISFFMDEVSFGSAPIMVANTFHEMIDTFDSVILQSGALSGDGTFHLVRDLFELDSGWKETKEESISFMSFPRTRESKSKPNTIPNRSPIRSGMTNSINIVIPQDFPEPNSEGYFKKCLALFTQIVEEKKGKSLIILHSKKSVEAFYRALLPAAESAGIKVLGVGVSGGIGKSLALFRENSESCVLLSTNQIIPYLEEIEEDIEVIVFQKIPFDSIADPVCKARMSQFENGFNEYTLPRAIMKFRELLGELDRGKPKTCYLLDSRLNHREYGRMFI